MNGYDVNGHEPAASYDVPPPPPDLSAPPPPPEYTEPPPPPEDLPPPPPPSVYDENGPAVAGLELKKKGKKGWGDSSAKRQPLSVEEILRKKKEADEAAAKVGLTQAYLMTNYIHLSSPHSDIPQTTNSFSFYVAQILD